MRRLFGFLIGLVIMLGVFASLYLSAAIYDTADKVVIEPSFFRAGLLSTEQVGTIKTLSDVQTKKLRDWLIQKFVYEYFYIEPDENNIVARTTANSLYSPLSYMSTNAVFEKWKYGEAVSIRDAAIKGVRRTVSVFDEIVKRDDSDYLQVDYETKTWYKPNDMTEVPTVDRGTIYLKVEYKGKVREPIESVQKALLNGIDPAVVFEFYVEDVMD